MLPFGGIILSALNILVSLALIPASSDPLALSGLVDRGAVSKPLQKGSPSEKLR
jgi:hypothetical protein